MGGCFPSLYIYRNGRSRNTSVTWISNVTGKKERFKTLNTEEPALAGGWT